MTETGAGSGNNQEQPGPSLIVGLGASAGGFEAFKSFFANMPPRTGLALVLVQHLDPNHKSILVELLSKHTDMPVLLAEDGARVVPDHVFVIPPNAVLTIEGGLLHLATPARPRAERKPIDSFFASLAADQQEKAVCIILAGSGSDGSLGVRAIKEHGGLTLAQAGFDETALLGMPSSAVATGLIDEVLPVEGMPAKDALKIQAQVVGGIADDTARLDKLVAESQAATGALQATQAGNQLTALAAKQSMQLQELLAAQSRAEDLDRASALTERARGQARLQQFIGDGTPNTPGQ